MRRSRRHYDEWADRLAVGDHEPHDADTVATFVGSLRSESVDDAAEKMLPTTLAAEAQQVAKSASTTGTRSRKPQLLTMRWRRRAMVSTFLSTLFGKIAIGSVAVAVAATGAAATGNLPDPAQQRVSDVLSNVGIHILPAPNGLPEILGGEATDDLDKPDGSVETTAPVLPDEASDKAKSVTDTVFGSDPTSGREFGEAVGGTASEGAAGGSAPDLPDTPVTPEPPEKLAAPELPEVPPAPEPELPEDADKGTSRRP